MTQLFNFIGFYNHSLFSPSLLLQECWSWACCPLKLSEGHLPSIAIGSPLQHLNLLGDLESSHNTVFAILNLKILKLFGLGL